MKTRIAATLGMLCFVVVLAFTVHGFRDASASCNILWDVYQPTTAEPSGPGGSFDYDLATSWTSHYKNTWDVVHIWESANSVNIASLTIDPSSQEVPIENPNVLESDVLAAVDVDGTLVSGESTGTAVTGSYDSPLGDCSGGWSVDIE